MLSKDLTSDIPASLVVFLVALPLSMGVALASGFPPAYGLATAIVGGIICSLFGGAPLQISGPSAGLTVLVLKLLQEFGAETFAIVVILSGLIQVVAGFFKIGRQFQAVSPAVIRGMLAGIGILIILSQFHVMIDSDIPGSGLDNLLGIPAALWKVFDGGDANHFQAAMIGIGTLTIVVLWERFKGNRLRVIPGALLAVLVASTIAALFQLKLRYVDVPGKLFDLVSLPSMASFGSMMDSNIFMAALGLAFVGSAETLLCAAAVARMHKGETKTNFDRALLAHGVANAVCGFLGFLPVTGVISRSTTNVEAGAQSRWSAVLHTVWITGFVFLFPDLLALVPTSSLAAILIYVGLKLVNLKAVRELARFGRPILIILAVTLIGVVTVDLLKGIVAGLVLTAGRLMYQMSHVHFELEKTPDPDGDGPILERWDLHMHGSATFLALPKLQDVLSEVKSGVELHFHFDELEFIDHACLDLLSGFRKRHEANGGLVVVEWDELFDLRGQKGRAIQELSSESSEILKVDEAAT